MKLTNPLIEPSQEKRIFMRYQSDIIYAFN